MKTLIKCAIIGRSVPIRSLYIYLRFTNNSFLININPLPSQSLHNLIIKTKLIYRKKIAVKLAATTNNHRYEMGVKLSKWTINHIQVTATNKDHQCANIINVTSRRTFLYGMFFLSIDSNETFCTAEK